MLSTKPFFLALETVLKTRLPPDAFAQVMEESLWEFEADADNPVRSRSPASQMRLASICLSFYRAMTKMGMSEESSLETIARAGANLSLPTDPVFGSSCSVAAYFRAKNALPLCRTLFCKACPQSAAGCAQAASEADDWTVAGRRV